MPNQRSRGRQDADVSVKRPDVNTVLRNKLAPDVPWQEVFTPAESTNTVDGAKGSTPGLTGGVSPIAMPLDNNRVPGRSGSPGPM